MDILLYADDLDKRVCYIHTNTKNESAIRLSEILKQRGVKNNKFHLVVTQPELLNIDPHSDDLSDEETLRIMYECRINPWYYLREVVKMNITGSLSGGYFRFDLLSVSMCWCFFNNVNIFATAARQLGKTTAAIAISSWVVFFGGANSSFHMLAKDRSLANDNVRTITEIMHGLPDYMLIKDITNDRENLSSIYYSFLKNGYYSGVAASNVVAADALGRGHSVACLHVDEPAYFRYIDVTHGVLMNSTITAMEQAKRHNSPHGVIFTTTSGKTDERSGKYSYELISNAAKFHTSMFDFKNREELHDFVRKNSLNQLVYIIFSYLQLGKDEEWFSSASMNASPLGDASIVERDLLNIWRPGISESFIKSSTLNTIRKYEKDPTFVEYREGYVTNWYISKEELNSIKFKSSPLIMGMDLSENTGNDFTSIVIINPADMKIVAVSRNNEINLLTMATYVVELLIKYDRLVWIPERNSQGATIIDIVITQLIKSGINPYNKIYNLVVQNLQDSAFKDVDLHDMYSVQDGSIRKHFGFRTMGGSRNIESRSNTRHQLYNNVLNNVLKYNLDKIYDSTIIRELGQLTIKNGRVDHMVGAHDDTTIAYLLACFLLFFGKNLNKYGLIEDLILTDVTEYQTKDSDTKSKGYNLDLYDEYIRLSNLYTSMTNTRLKNHYYNELVSLEKKIDFTIIGKNVLSLDVYNKDTAIVKTPVQHRNTKIYNSLKHIF